MNLPPARWWIADSDACYAIGAKRLMRQRYALTADLGEAQDVVQRRARVWERWRTLSAYEDPESCRRVPSARWRTRWRTVRFYS